MKRNRKFLLVGVVPVAALLGFAYWGMHDGAKESPYITAAVQSGNLTQVVTATGTLQAVITVQVGSQVSGTIAKLNADFNSKVKQGQIVALLDQDKFKAAVDQAKANVLSSQANEAKSKVAVEDAKRTLDRNRELRKRELVAQSDLDTAETAYNSAVAQEQVSRAQVELAKAALQQAQVDLDHTVIRSPVDGIVVSRNVDVGQTVAASLQAPVLFLIANDLSKMQVDTNVSEGDVGNVWVDQDSEFTVDAYPTRRFQGKVLQVRNAPIMVQNVVTYDAVVGVDNKDLLLKPGMTANVQFMVSRKEAVLKVPNAALRFRPPESKPQPQAAAAAEQENAPRAGGNRGGGNRQAAGGGQGQRGGRAREGTLYVLRDGKAVPEKIRLGITDGTSTEVAAGAVKEGEQVIVAMSSAAQARANAPRRPFGF
ncbi:MAG TPA: efflux RND transporter periplasmic adaptor subunit [Candidatus Binatia bacterium]